MGSPTTAKQRDSLNANFGDDPVTAMGTCPMQNHIAIFPTRYALDETAESLTNSQGPHIAANPNRYPKLQTRSYVVRQIRDGWLYVWNASTKTFHEYSVQGHQFTRHKWRESTEVRKDIRNNPTETKSYIEYPKQSHLYIAYSPLQWTWRQCEQVRTSPHKISQWMTEVNLAAYLDTAAISPDSHIQPLSKLGELVADIKPAASSTTTASSNHTNTNNRKANGEGDFYTTMIATQPREEQQADPEQPYQNVKPIFNENTILGNCPDRHSAIMVALHDPNSLIDDLILNLVERWAALGKLDKDNHRKIETGIQCLQLSAARFIEEELLPEHIKNDPNNLDKKYQCIKDINEYFRLYDIRMTSIETRPLIGITRDYEDEKKRQEIEQKYGIKLTSLENATKNYSQWSTYQTYQSQIRFAELLDYLTDIAQQQKQYQQQIERREQDLRNWLELLDTEVTSLFIDPIASNHALYLLERTSITYKYLALTESGKNWINTQIRNPSSLFGYALYSGNKELAQAFDKAAQELKDKGRIEMDVSFTSNIASRAAEVNTILGLDGNSFQQSVIYKALTEPAQQIYETLRQITANAGQKAWLSIAENILPAISSKFMPQEKILSYITTVTLIPVEKISIQLHIDKNLNFDEQFTSWQHTLKRIDQDINRNKAIIASDKSTATEKQTARTRLKDLNPHREKWVAHMPEEFYSIKATASTATVMEPHSTTTPVFGLGKSAALELLEARLKGTAESMRHGKAWINQKFGGALPLVICALNALNLKNIIEQTLRDGTLTESERKELISNAAYTTNAAMALWVMPMWSRYTNMVVEGLEKTVIQSTLTDFKILATRTSATSVQQEAYQIAKQITKRAAMFTAIGTLAASYEAWNVYDEYQREDDATIKWLHSTKGFTLAGMAFLGSIQTGTLLLARWFRFTWVFGPAMGTILMVLGLAYLIITIFISLLTRNNLQKWLDFSYWGKEKPNYWPDTDEGFIEQTNTLHRILIEPQLQVNQTMTVYEARTDMGNTIKAEHINGFWLGLRLPSNAAGSAVSITPLLVDIRGVINTNNQALEISKQTYQDLFAERKGQWLKPENDQAWILPQQKPSRGSTPQLAEYKETDHYRYWQIWIECNNPATALELEITYPAGILTDTNGNIDNQLISYTFRVKTSVTNKVVDIQNNYFTKSIPDTILLARRSNDSKATLTLIVPN